jgi:CAAX protease family protein
VVGDHPSALARRRPGALVIVARLVLATFAYLTALTGLEAMATLLMEDRTGPFVGLAIAEAAALGTVLLVWRFVDRRPLRELGLVLELAPRRWLRGALVAALMMSFIVLVWYTLINGATWLVNPDVGRAALALVAGFVGFLIQGPSEELLYRGYVLENVRDRWGVGWGIAVSAITFSLLHAANPAFGLLPGLNLALFGVATALYKLRWDQGQLWGVFAIHTVWNWLQQVVFGLPNSGNVSPLENVLFQVRPDSSMPDFMWGGGFGPEGTLGATLVLGALIWAELRRR